MEYVPGVKNPVTEQDAIPATTGAGLQLGRIAPPGSFNVTLPVGLCPPTAVLNITVPVEDDGFTFAVSASVGVRSGFTFTGLTCGTAYSLGVRAYDGVGNRGPAAFLGAATGSC